MRDLDAMARRLRVEVIHQNIRSANGLWLPEHRVIILRRGMKRAHHRSVYAHELAHATFEHISGDPREEAQADRHAADTLITEGEVRAASKFGPHVNEIAHELSVTPQLLRVWLSYHFPS
jgi:Zn-dependent peptidase ImmA (M78 family)